MMRPPKGHPEGQFFGGLDDDSFPTPRTLRRILAYLLDVAAHVSIAACLVLVGNPAAQHAIAQEDWNALRPSVGAIIGCFLLISFIDRVLVQAKTHTTIGKVVFGLVIIDRDTGRYPRMRWLLATWLVGLFLALMVPIVLIAMGGGAGPDRPERYLLPAVRRRDVVQPPTESAS
ncbi:RDD family protein [Nocardia sp. NPDC058658]|uniref:RDD family protein n=1 Tax=Nocardia sp. NPDC058658 TaxID=3346580 RepID=UPI0036544B56